MKPIIGILSILLILIILLRFHHIHINEGFESASKSVVICKADWCGHCKKAAPEFSKLLSASPITLNDGSKATVKILDGDKDKAEMAQYKVKGFPTILIVDGGQTTEYPGERTAEGVINFLNSNY
jgi:thiol-disulfide isomerase/thioredoxin